MTFHEPNFIFAGEFYASQQVLDVSIKFLSKALPDLFISQLRAKIAQYQIAGSTSVLLEECSCWIKSSSSSHYFEMQQEPPHYLWKDYNAVLLQESALLSRNR